MINIDDIEKIIQVVDKFNFSHFEFEQEKSKIIIDKNIITETKINEVRMRPIPLIASLRLQCDCFSLVVHQYLTIPTCEIVNVINTFML